MDTFYNKPAKIGFFFVNSRYATIDGCASEMQKNLLFSRLARKFPLRGVLLPPRTNKKICFSLGLLVNLLDKT